jgi:Chaperonin 10 Kd subunit
MNQLVPFTERAPALIAAVGAHASYRFFEFLTANICNPHTRRAYARVIIPDTVKEKPQEGEIIAVGPGGRDASGKLTPLNVKAGDKVLFAKWGAPKLISTAKISSL